jgi:hypothetical protein
MLLPLILGFRLAWTIALYVLASVAHRIAPPQNTGRAHQRWGFVSLAQALSWYLTTK